MLDDGGLPPRGPRGADPGVLTEFGAGEVDLERLGALLRGEGLDREEQVFTERRHWAVAEVLNLSPAPLTIAFRHAEVSSYPGAVLVPGGG